MENEILTTKGGEEVKVDKEKFVGFTKDEKWEGANIQAQSTPLIDPLTGEPLIIRNWIFQLNPEFRQKNKSLKGIDKQELFNNFWKLVEIDMWKDGLVPNTDFDPKLEFKGKKHFLIQIICKPRRGVILVDQPQKIEKYLKKS